MFPQNIDQSNRFLGQMNSAQITNADITFCIQGQLSFDDYGSNQTEKLIDSITKFFPSSPKIFATWRGQDLTSLKNRDLTIIELEDPGSLPRYAGSNLTNNINRQIRSSKAAVNSSITRYSVKVRSDLIFQNNRLKKILASLPPTPDHPNAWFDTFVVFLDRLTINPDRELPIAMHPSDYIQAGLTTDLKSFWALPEMSSSDERFFLEGNLGGLEASDGHIPRHRAETYFWKQFVFRNSGQDLESLLTRDESLEIRTLDSFAQNIIPLNKLSIGITSQKYEWDCEPAVFIYAYVFSDWMKDYRKLTKEYFAFPVHYIESLGPLYRALVRIKHFIFKP